MLKTLPERSINFSTDSFACCTQQCDAHTARQVVPDMRDVCDCVVMVMPSIRVSFSFVDSQVLASFPDET